MMKRVMSCMAVLMLVGTTAWAGEIDLENVQCVVAPKDAQATKSAEYKEGKVFFCCGGCAGKFAKNTEKYAANANRQLVQTEQYVQKACPISGKETNPEITLTVAGTKVAFCCKGCQGKVSSADKEEQITLVFSEKAFKKAFKKAEEKKEGES